MKELTNTQKGRIFSFIAIATILLFFILLMTWNIRIQTPAVAYTDSCNMDGADFSPAANLCIAGFNGFVMFITMVFSVGIVWVLSTVAVITWRCIAIQKTSVVTKLEYKIAKYTWLTFTILSLIGCLILLQLSHLFYCTLLTSLPILLMWVLGVLPLQNNYLKQKNTTIEN
mgnify:CR=1 FL=1